MKSSSNDSINTNNDETRQDNDIPQCLHNLHQLALPRLQPEHLAQELLEAHKHAAGGLLSVMLIILQLRIDTAESQGIYQLETNMSIIYQN